VGPGRDRARCQWSGCEGEGERVTGRRWGTDMRAQLAQCRAARFKLGLKLVQNYSNDSNEF
jgi:hypothetical protein